MQNVWIVGASGFGREVYCWLSDVIKHNGSDKNIKIVGFLDSEKTAMHPDKVLGLLDGNAKSLNIKVIEDFSPASNDLFVCGLGEPKLKARLVPLLLNKGCKFLSVIHPQATVSINVSIADGAVILPFTIISTNVRIGSCFLLNGGGAVIGHDVIVGDYCTLGPGGHLLGHCKIGNRVWIADRGTVLPNAIVEDDVKIGASSVVIKKAKQGKTYMGNPAVAAFDY